MQFPPRSLFIPAVLAAQSVAEVSQRGNDNLLTASQTGANFAEVMHFIRQDGTGIGVSVSQQGFDHAAEIMQTGSHHSAAITQSGADDIATVTHGK